MCEYNVTEETTITHHLKINAPRKEVEAALDEIGEDCSLLDLWNGLESRFGVGNLSIEQGEFGYRDKISVEEKEEEK